MVEDFFPRMSEGTFPASLTGGEKLRAGIPCLLRYLHFGADEVYIPNRRMVRDVYRTPAVPILVM